jgi:hypothetical protein
MMPLGLASEHELFWWITLGLGAVVLSVVILLLSLLLSYVKDVNRGVQAIWDMASRVAAQTVCTWMLPTTVEMVTALREELGLHVKLLTPAK